MTANDVNEIARKLGAAVAARRGVRGMSGVALSRAAGVTQAHVSMIESGRRCPSVPVLKRLAVALGTTVAELVADV